MSARTFTIADKVKVVEQLIEDHRWARDDELIPENLTYRVLKAIASDLRGRLKGAPEGARRAIGHRIAVAVKSKTSLGYETGTMIGVGQEVIGRWPTLEQALERFEIELEKQ